jgi:hypothetical protein
MMHKFVALGAVIACTLLTAAASAQLQNLYSPDGSWQSTQVQTWHRSGAGSRRVVERRRVVHDRPLVIEHRRVVDDPPRVIERYIVVDDDCSNRRGLFTSGFGFERCGSCRGNCD